MEPAAWSVRDPAPWAATTCSGTLFALTGRGARDAILDGDDAIAWTATLGGRLRRLSVCRTTRVVVFRVLGTGSAPVRRRIREFRGLVRQQVLGVAAGRVPVGMTMGGGDRQASRGRQRHGRERAGMVGCSSASPGSTSQVPPGGHE